MAYDIYGNVLKSGYCEVHPHMPQSYPCDLCYEEERKYRKEQELMQEPEPTLMDYIGFDYKEFSSISQEVIVSSVNNNEDDFRANLGKLLKLLPCGLITELLRYNDKEK